MLTSRITRKPALNSPLVLAAFSFRHDVHLVPGLLQNIARFTHGYVAWDDRSASLALSTEPARRNTLLAEARRLGARWVLAVDPDERFEDRLAARMPEMLAEGDSTLWHFDLREMFTPEAYRIDGIWGSKTLARLFPMAAVTADLRAPLHASWIVDDTPFTRRNAGINLYHLRMATPARRAARRALYAAADPDRAFQRIGYDYLDDERGMILQPVAAARRFSPAFVEDHGLWGPDAGAAGNPCPDPQEARLAYAATAMAQAGQTAAYFALHDLCNASPDDDDLRHAAAALALRARLLPQAEAAASAILARDAGDLHARALRATVCLGMGQRDAARADIAALTRFAPGAVTAALHAEWHRPDADFAAAGALWQRWVSGPAQCREGAQVAQAAMAVVVLGLGAPREMAEAVASLVAQDEAAEIVVVNSGGGAPEVVLQDWLDRIRLIAIDAPLRVGAARNIGIDASRAPYIGFLAADCIAAAGWVSGRMQRHRAGAAMVSTPVLSMPGAGLVAQAASLLKYWVRNPRTAEADISHFGRSYARWIVAETGPFPPGLRVNEDGWLNRYADRIARPDWAAEVHTHHRDPEHIWSLLADHRARGTRRAHHAPFRAMAGAPDRAKRLAAEFARRRRGASRAVDALPQLVPGRRWLMKALQWLASRIDRASVAKALWQIAATDRKNAERTSRHTADAARAELRLAAAADDEDWRRAYALGLAEVQAGDGPAAEAAFRRALARAPQAHLPLAALLAQLRERAGPEAALAAAESAANAAPHAASAWLEAARAAQLAGQPTLALAHARRALGVAPDHPKVHHMLAHLHGAAGNGRMAAFRTLALARLRAAEARQQAALQ